MNDSNDTRAELKREWQEAASILQLFQEELSFYLKVIKTKDPNALMMMRRSYVRTFFAAIDAISYRFHQIALHASKVWHELDSNELLVIEALTITSASDKPTGLITPSINKTGELNLKPSELKVPTLDLFRFSIRVFEKAHRLNHSLPERGDTEWQRLEKSVSLRNRLTHPKRPEDLSIRDDEFDNLTKVAGWFFGTVADRIGKVIERADSDMYPK